jgi:hypothetical protein
MNISSYPDDEPDAAARYCLVLICPDVTIPVPVSQRPGDLSCGGRFLIGQIRRGHPAFLVKVGMVKYQQCI